MPALDSPTPEMQAVCFEVAGLLADIRHALESGTSLTHDSCLVSNLSFDMERLDGQKMIEALGVVERNFRPRIEGSLLIFAESSVDDPLPK